MQFVLENLWAVYDAVLRRLVVAVLTCNPVALRVIQLRIFTSPNLTFCVTVTCRKLVLLWVRGGVVG